jgi:hypothetical protein
MTNELAPIDITQTPELAWLVEEVEATGKRRRFTRGTRTIAVVEPAEPAVPAEAAAPADEHAVLAELDRRLRQGMNIAEATAGILQPYATGSRRSIQETIRAEKEAFVQGVADEVMGRTET